MQNRSFLKIEDTMTKRGIRSFGLILMLGLASRFAFSQQQGPVGYDEIRNRITIGETAFVNFVTSRKVDFVLTDAQIQELQKLGGVAATPRKINAIKDNPAPGSIQITCRPADCDISIASTKPEWEGKTSSGKASHDLAPGTYRVEVRAAGFVTMKDAAFVEVGKSRPM